MTEFPITTYRLAKRTPQGVGLVCDPDGVMLGPAALVFREQGAFRAVPASTLARLLSAAYGPGFKSDIAYRLTKLSTIAQALTEGRYAEAAISALHLRLPELPSGAATRLAKYSPDQPRP